MASKHFVLGLTGGIGCGKSVVADEFARLGAQIIDADRISHELSRPPSPALLQIAGHFGIEFLDTNGEMDRKKMRALVFSNPEAKNKLERIFHPLILQEAIHRLAQPLDIFPYTVLVAPLLFEIPSFLELVDHTAVIDCSPELQVERVKLRSALKQSQIESIMGAQITREDRLKRADTIIENCGTLTELHERISEFHLRCLQLAKGM